MVLVQSQNEIVDYVGELICSPLYYPMTPIAIWVRSALCGCISRRYFEKSLAMRATGSV